MKRLLALVVLFLSVAGWSRAADDPWKDFRFLMGDWEADGGPGKGTGHFSLAPDLQGKVLVRKNHAELPAVGNRPAANHDDLMVIYRDSPKTGFRAIYFDSEGHVIHYAVSLSDDQRTLTFLSEPAPATPRYRLTYRKGENETVGIRFEIALPGKPDAFRKYLEGSVRRKRKPATEGRK
jgi:hypothetical protein